MTDYSKLTVAKLKDELDKRGLPKSGLKAVLVQRLNDADAKTESADAHEEPPDIQTAEVEKAGTIDTNAPQDAEKETQERVNGLGKEEAVAEDAPAAANASPEPVKHAEGSQPDGSLEEQEKPAEHIEEEDTGPAASKDGTSLMQDIPADKPEPRSLSDSSMTLSVTQSDVLPGQVSQPATVSASQAQLPTPSQTQSEQTVPQPDFPSASTQASVTGEEMLEDSRKRKRRSQSPPPSSIDTTKRLKGASTRPHVELPEDSKTQTDTADSFADTKLNGHQKSESDDQTPKASTEAPEPTQQATSTPSAPVSTENLQPKLESPSKPDTRFKSLFPPARQSSQDHSQEEDTTKDRLTTPSLHPATPALYIRNLMRPLNPTTLKSHLTNLALPPNGSSEPPTSEDPLAAFHLDSIRTHCLARFTSTTGAARVRSALHDRVWPQERDRKPLWIDFVPEEKLEKWIAVETEGGAGRGAGMKRWEVVYEPEDGEVKAYLQEAGTGAASGSRLQQPQQAASQVGAAGKQEEEDKKSASLVKKEEAPKPAETPAFKALDDLFSSTAAKQKLYYLPVSKNIANRRLDSLDAGRGGGRGGGEMLRYTFQDGDIVSNGPEFGRGGRGGFRGGGGYRRRGGERGGWRGGDWRDGGRRGGY